MTERQYVKLCQSQDKASVAAHRKYHIAMVRANEARNEAQREYDKLLRDMALERELAAEKVQNAKKGT